MGRFRVPIQHGPNPADIAVTCVSCGIVKYYAPSEVRRRNWGSSYKCNRCTRREIAEKKQLDKTRNAC